MHELVGVVVGDANAKCLLAAGCANADVELWIDRSDVAVVRGWNKGDGAVSAGSGRDSLDPCAAGAAEADSLAGGGVSRDDIYAGRGGGVIAADIEQEHLGGGGLTAGDNGLDTGRKACAAGDFERNGDAKTCGTCGGECAAYGEVGNNDCLGTAGTRGDVNERGGVGRGRVDVLHHEHQQTCVG